MLIDCRFAGKTGILLPAKGPCDVKVDYFRGGTGLETIAVPTSIARVRFKTFGDANL